MKKMLILVVNLLDAAVVTLLSGLEAFSHYKKTTGKALKAFPGGQHFFALLLTGFDDAQLKSSLPPIRSFEVV